MNETLPPTGVPEQDHDSLEDGSTVSGIAERVAGGLATSLARIENPNGSAPESVARISVQELNLSISMTNILKFNGINSVNDLLPLSYADIRRFRHLTRKGYVELRDKLIELGVTLREE